MSVFFSQLSISNIVYENLIDMGCFLTVIATILSYFFVFYSISKISLLETIPGYLYVIIFISSILILLIGMSDIRGILIKVLLSLLLVILFVTFNGMDVKEKQKETSKQYLYLIAPFCFIAMSFTYSFAYSSELLIEDEDIWLENIEYDESGLVHATLFLQMTALKNDANDIRIKIICQNQVALDKGECVLLGLDRLRKGEKRTVKWDIVFENNNTHSFFLYLVCISEISNEAVEKPLILSVL